MSVSKKEQPDQPKQITVANETEEERLRRKISRPDMEKFLSFSRMLRVNAMYKNAKVTHK